MLNRIKKMLEKKAVVLMYHRIAEPDTDPWQLSVSPANFEQQLQVLSKGYRVVTLSGLLDQHERGEISPRSVCLTFDDGYADNYLNAKPLLEKYRCPATFFLPTHFIGSRQLFWWDELESILLRTGQLPSSLQIHIGGKPVTAELRGEEMLTAAQWQQHTSWVWHQQPPTHRCALYMDLWKRIRALPFSEVSTIMEQIRTWAATKSPIRETDVPITLPQMYDLLDHELFDAGLHTVTHPDLSSHPEYIQRNEIVKSIEFFQSKGTPTNNSIAYPYGCYNEATLAQVRKLQLAAAFTTHGEPVTRHSDRYQLGRFQVNDWSGKEFALHLRRWGRSLFH